MRKNIKNYTSEVPVPKTLNVIQEILNRAGVRKMMYDYDSGNNPVQVTFGIEVEGKGLIAYTLPVSVEKLAMILYKRKKSFNMLTAVQKESVRRTAWKNIQDWIDSQMAMIETEQVKLEHVFLPYMQTGPNETLYDRFQSGKLLGAGPG